MSASQVFVYDEFSRNIPGFAPNAPSPLDAEGGIAAASVAKVRPIWTLRIDRCLSVYIPRKVHIGVLRRRRQHNSVSNGNIIVAT